MTTEAAGEALGHKELGEFYKGRAVAALETADGALHTPGLERVSLMRAGVFASLAGYHATLATLEQTDMDRRRLYDTAPRGGW
jgi:hypothetical protein